MNYEEIKLVDANRCAHCGKNLQLVKKKYHVLQGEQAFCTETCRDFHASNLDSDSKSKRSKSRSPFVKVR